MHIRILDLDGSVVQQQRLLRRTQAAIATLSTWGPRIRLACSWRRFHRFESALAGTERPGAEAIIKALTIVDYQVGFNKVLGRWRQRFSFRILARSGELARLIAWYSR